MIHNKPILFYIISSEKQTFQWLKATISIARIKLKGVEQITVDDVLKIEKSTTHQAVLLIEKHLYINNMKALDNNLHQLLMDIPILLLAENFEYGDINTDVVGSQFIVIDSIARPSLSINLLEHTVNALIKDFSMTQELKKLAHYDALTGAANRHLFQDRVSLLFENAKRQKASFAIICFDLNGFKKVNDTYGHEVGDSLLQKFVSELDKTKRETDTLARLGGDEFTMIINNISPENLEKLLEKIINLFVNDFDIDGHQIKIRTAIGAVLINEKLTQDMTLLKLLKLADEAVYQAKLNKETSVVSQSISDI